MTAERDRNYERSADPGGRPPASGWVRLRLIAGLSLPYLAVTVGMLLARNVYLAFALYVAACTLGPWAVLGAQPFRAEGGFPWLPERGQRAAALRAGVWMWLLCGPAMAVAYLAARPWLGDSARYVARLRALGWQDERFVLFGCAFVIAIPWVEEWWWRGQALPRCQRAFGDRVGTLLAAVAFTGYHGVVLAQLYPVGPVLLRLCAILPVALWWCAVARRHRSWLGPWLAHGPGADLAMVLLFAWIHRQR